TAALLLAQGLETLSGERLVARGVPRHPVDDAPIEVDAVTRSALSDEHVASAGIANELGRHLARGDQSGEELLALTDRAPLVGFAVEDEGRGRDLVDVVDRRETTERVPAFGDSGVHLPRSEPHPDVARAEERLLIHDRRAD